MPICDASTAKAAKTDAPAEMPSFAGPRRRGTSTTPAIRMAMPTTSRKARYAPPVSAASRKLEICGAGVPGSEASAPSQPAAASEPSAPVAPSLLPAGVPLTAFSLPVARWVSKFAARSRRRRARRWRRRECRGRSRGGSTPRVYPLAMLAARVVTRSDELMPVVAAWDRLAQDQGRPFSSPAWILPWWQCVAAPAGRRLRTVLVTDGADVVAVFPVFVQRTRTGLNHYRLLASEMSAGAEPLVRGASLAEVAPLALEQLLASDPALDVLQLEGVRAETGWDDVVRRCWPGPSPWIDLVRGDPAPYVDFAGATFDDWLASKSTGFRKQMR